MGVLRVQEVKLNRDQSPSTVGVQSGIEEACSGMRGGISEIKHIAKPTSHLPAYANTQAKANKRRRLNDSVTSVPTGGIPSIAFARGGTTGQHAAPIYSQDTMTAIEEGLDEEEGWLGVPNQNGSACGDFSYMDLQMKPPQLGGGNTRHTDGKYSDYTLPGIGLPSGESTMPGSNFNLDSHSLSTWKTISWAYLAQLRVHDFSVYTTLTNPLAILYAVLLKVLQRDVI
ncbi:uncharacterized protein EV422DRAFT_506729 [Fimicolochytrium jonesii]|uniref:uncharacterized protein n=1 Tax=Fimicolochytrium jonesii TaxID=1396493 RepID=UPI0022FF2849|nr:uncharacterized protein EV422DRAFT_506729 [Fimicolochytrium jonesii]KAI8820495.1 hypothetical protein EV422DRAFT_506729 [Fimicolochytrium jonesii]